MTQVDQVLKTFLARAPDLEIILNKVADRYHKRGVLNGRQKVAREDRIYGDLCDLFGQDAVLRDKHDHLTLRYDRFFETVPHDEWVQALHRVLGRTLATAQDTAREEDKAVTRLIKAWTLLHPTEEGIHYWLQQHRGKWAKQLETNDAAAIHTDWVSALQIRDFLLDHSGIINLADLSARFTGNSKTLRSGSMLATAASWLALARNEAPPETTRDRNAYLLAAGLVVNLTSIKVTLGGPLIYTIGNKRYDWIQRLWQLGQSATLSLDNLADITHMTLTEPTRIITCENEAPFVNLLTQGKDLCIYTEGFPNAAVKKVLELLGKPKVLHWGDSDLNGLRIAAMLTDSAQVQLWRCALADLQTNKARLLPLEARARARTLSFLDKYPEFPFRRELAFTLEHGWLEQESWN